MNENLLASGISDKISHFDELLDSAIKILRFKEENHRAATGEQNRLDKELSGTSDHTQNFALQSSHQNSNFTDRTVRADARSTRSSTIKL